MKKGQLVYIEGRIRTRSWEDKDGMKRYTTEVLGDRFTMLGRKNENQSAAPTDASGDDDLPF